MSIMTSLNCVKYTGFQKLNLVDLPLDELIEIFKYCDSITLRNLSKTCKRFYNVASLDCVWLNQSRSTLVTNQLCSEMKKRCLKVLTSKERCRIGANWREGVYLEKIYHTTKCMPRLVLESSILWLSRGQSILKVQRNKQHLEMEHQRDVKQLEHKEYISRFVKVDDVLFSGGRQMIYGWSTSGDELLFKQHSGHTQDILGLDCKQNILASSSKDGTIKVWQVEEDVNSLHCHTTIEVYDRVWCVNINPAVNCVAAGSAGYQDIYPLSLYDLESGVKLPLTRSEFRKGAATFDIIWESPDCLITCGHDTIIRLWDTRVGKCVSCWTDPFDSAGYCLASDLSFSIICGTAHHGRAQLWDKRSPVSVQAYFGKSRANSPVYSVGFDSSHLFIAQDQCLNMFDFSNYSETRLGVNYRSVWSGKMIIV